MLAVQEHMGYLTLRVCKDKNGWAKSLLRYSGLRVVPVAEGYRLKGIALEMQTLRLLQRLAEYGVRAKLLPFILGV